jgi:hypothetical protein
MIQRIRRTLSGGLAAAIFGALAATASGQVPSSYGAYYTQSAGMRGVQSSSRYLYDKYFYQRPTVSPYMSLARPGGDAATSYQTFVRPELERREAASRASMAYVQQRKLEGRVGETRFPGAGFIGGTVNDAILKPAPQVPKVSSTPSSYYNHWYGGWGNR